MNVSWSSQISREARKAASTALCATLLLAGCGRAPLAVGTSRDAALAGATADEPATSAATVAPATLVALRDELAAGQRLIGKPLAFKDDGEVDAYLRSLALCLPTKDYDREGFLASLGLPPSYCSGRTDAATFRVVLALKGYRPGTLVNGKEILPQVMAFDVAVAEPWLFLHMIAVSNASVEAGSRERAAWKQPFEPLEDLTPLPDAPQQHYAAAFAKYHGIPKGYSVMFDDDVHAGLAHDPGSQPFSYGSYEIALGQGFTPAQAQRIAANCNGIDEDTTPYGKTSFTPSGQMDRHFNLDRSAQDTRLVWAQRHLEAASALAHQHAYDQAEVELGCGLHSLQDIFAHGQLTPSMHGVIGEFPDQVTFNPVGLFEATRATVAYFHAYLKGLGGVSALYLRDNGRTRSSSVRAL